MPHDRNGQMLNVGDEVILRAKVTSISPGEQFCNCTVEATEKPEGECPTVVTCNSKFFEKVADAAPAETQAAPAEEAENAAAQPAEETAQPSAEDTTVSEAIKE